MRIYVASKLHHVEMWKQLRSDGFHLCASWLDAPWLFNDEQATAEELSDIWCKVIDEASSCDVLVVYAEHGENLRGAYVEVGCALASGKKIHVVGAVEGDWLHHPNVHRFETVIDAIAHAYVYESQQMKKG